MTNYRASRAALFSPVILLFLAITAFSQQTQSPSNPPLGSLASQPQRIAGKSTMMCAGYIKNEKFSSTPEIVGAEEEQEQRTFSEGDMVYINAGSNQSVREGQMFQVVRPKGNVKGVHRQKTGFLGTYVQELGQLTILKVHEKTSLAQVTFTCDTMRFGDLLTPLPNRESLLARAGANLDRFADPSGKRTGRLMMAKDNREMITQRHIAYIDLGAEDQVKLGDYLTIYRPLGTGNVTRIDNEETARNRSYGFESDRYKGGGFSNLATRAKDSTAFHGPDGRYSDRPITFKEVKRNRPLMPRKIVGEMVVIDVQTRTATVVITRVASEVHTGDWVEIQ
jgi:hypothetical protein